MKILIFLLFIFAIVYAIFWKMRKSQAEADLAKRKLTELRRQKEKEALSPEQDLIWPVVSVTTSEDLAARDESESEGLAMTSIDYEPPEQIAS